jgi:hypothetical protein
MERVEKRQVRFAEKLYTVYEVPAEDETRNGMVWIILGEKRREERRKRKKVQGILLKNEKGEDILVPHSGIFI